VAASGTDAVIAGNAKGKGKDQGVVSAGEREDKIISPELRKLLSRKVDVLVKEPRDVEAKR
jgi:hypothetical protein